MCNVSHWLILLLIKLKNDCNYKDRYTTKIVTDVKKIDTHMFFNSTCLYHVYISEYINLLTSLKVYF